MAPSLISDCAVILTLILLLWGSVHPQLVQTAQFPQAQGEQLARLGRGNDPRGRRREPSIAVAAHEQDGFALHAGRDVGLKLDTVVAEGA
jgi:hypothetical protein